MHNETIKKLEFWSHLSQAQQKLLLSSTIVQTLPKGKVLYHQGEKGKRIGILTTGKLHLIQSVKKGTDVILHVAHSGDVFGETLLTPAGVYQYRVESVEESIVVLISLPEFLQIFQNNPMVSWSMYYGMVKRMRSAEIRLVDYHLLSATQRLRKILRGYMEREGRQLVNGEIEISCRLTHELLARLCFVSRAYISMELTNLRKEGIIEYDRRRMIIRRPDLL